MAKSLLFMGFLLTCMSCLAVSDIASDQRECSSQLFQLMPCISYVEGFNKIPTIACCNNLVQIYSASPKCLCLIMMNSSATALGNGININHTLAMQMPQACQMGADISRCPGLLHISPKSPEAKPFKLNTTTSASAPQVVVGFSPPPTNIPLYTSNLGFQVKAEKTWAVFTMALMLSILINGSI